jgi:hypothetical protein
MATAPDPTHLLAPTATIAERTHGLLMLLPPNVLADAVGVRISTLRNWASGQSKPRFDAAIPLDDLRTVARILLDGGLEPGRVAAWLTSRDPELWHGLRPVEVVRHDPMDVIGTAHGVVLEYAKSRQKEAEKRRAAKLKSTLVLASK